MQFFLSHIYSILFSIAALVVLFLAMFTVKQQTAAVIERFGKFLRIAQPGLGFKIPFIDTIAKRASLAVEQLVVEVETKTADNVFVKLEVCVQNYILPAKVYEAFYKLNDAGEQIESYVVDVVRSKVPKMKLDDVFEKKDEIANAIKTELTEEMDDYGFGIKAALVTDIDPDEKVKNSMNEINAAQRLREAASEKGEADRILKVKAAEAEAQSKALQGEGIAKQRAAIVDGLRGSVQEFQKAVDGVSASDVMTLVLMTQYFDTLKELSNGDGSTVFVPHSPGALGDISNQIRMAIMTGNQVGSKT